MGVFWSLPSDFKNHYAPQYLNNIDTCLLMVAHVPQLRTGTSSKQFFADLSKAAKAQESTYIEILWYYSSVVNNLCTWDGECQLCGYKGLNTKFLYGHLVRFHYQRYRKHRNVRRKKQLDEITKVKADWAVEWRGLKRRCEITKQIKTLQKQLAIQQEQIAALTLLVQKLVDH